MLAKLKNIAVNPECVVAVYVTDRGRAGHPWMVDVVIKGTEKESYAAWFPDEESAQKAADQFRIECNRLHLEVLDQPPSQ